jgi:hypothetical protein
VESWRGRGTYGAVYRAVRVGAEHTGPVALKVAVNPGDPRFEREVALLSRVHHAHVPALRDHGQWQCEDRSFPYLAMQWVEGVPLYDWSEVHNPTSRQILRLLAQVARALAATHEATGVHRDMKGDNVLVRADSQAFLTDFGASTYAGAAPLTWEPLPPGTPTYRSPEAWRFGLAARKLKDAHYEATPADDAFGLGVTAYRLVTDEYPPATDPGLPESLLWYAPSAGPRPPHVLNPRVDPQLSMLILRMLSNDPEARGSLQEIAGLLEQRAEQAGPKADQRLFAWETLAPSAWARAEAAEAYSPHQRLRHRVQEVVRATEQRELAEKAEAARQEAEALSRAMSPPRQAAPPARTEEWPPGLAAAAVTLLMVLGGWLATRGFSAEEPTVAQADEEDAGTADGGTAELANEVLAAHVKETWIPTGRPGLHKDIPSKPLPGQRRPENTGRCRNPAQVAVNGGCWTEFISMKPPCDDGAYEWRGRCYEPVYTAPREPTSTPREPSHGTP